MYIIQFSHRLNFKNPMAKKKKNNPSLTLKVYTVYRHCEINRGL